MPPRFPLKDIAFQAGLSLATVDRVLHGRAHVRQTTRARVAAAIEELTRQYGQAGLAGRRFTIDVVMEAPRRFTNAVRHAFEAEVPGMRPASFSARFHLGERMTTPDLTAILKAIARRGSHGVVLKAPANAATAEASARLIAGGIPVVTYVTDLPAAVRTAYVGMDNHAAGAAAAWLMGPMLGPEATVLITLSSATFSGEEAREAGFRTILAEAFPRTRAVTVSEGKGMNATTGALVARALEEDPSICAVYSAGGGNRAILSAFAAARRAPRVFAAHDLDATNTQLLRARKLTFVLHHDLRADARTVCQLFLSFHRMLPDGFQAAPSKVAIATPFDLPAP